MISYVDYVVLYMYCSTKYVYISTDMMVFLCILVLRKEFCHSPCCWDHQVVKAVHVFTLFLAHDCATFRTWVALPTEPLQLTNHCNPCSNLLLEAACQKKGVRILALCPNVVVFEHFVWLCWPCPCVFPFRSHQQCYFTIWTLRPTVRRPGLASLTNVGTGTK